MTPFEVLCGLTAILFLLYYYLTSTFDYWKIRGIPGPKPVPIFGTISRVMRAKMSMGDYVTTLYEEYKDESFVGIFVRRQPVLIVNDLEFCKYILIKNFPEFASRGATVHLKVERIGQNLFFLEPERWRPLRTEFSRLFTSGKMKQMFYLLRECAEDFEKYINEIAEKGETVDVRDLTGKFTTDVIGSCVFGLKMNAMSDEESAFRKMGKDTLLMTRSRSIKMLIRDLTPRLYIFLAIYCHVDMAERKVQNFFINFIKQTVKHRECSQVLRNDFVDLLIELKNNPSKLGDIEFSDDLMASQAVVFFIAGFETSSTTMSNALYEMALNTRVQDKVRLEMEEQMKKDGGKLTYDGVKEMKYLDMVVQETLRKYPPITFLTRQTTTDYTFSGTKLTLPKGQAVWIPVYAIQRDPTIFPKADYFDPERFTPEAIASRHPMCHLPFGGGPRNCIGDFSEEHGERCHQDMKDMEKRYQGTWGVNMMADYCWSLKRNVVKDKKSNKRRLLPRSFEGKQVRYHKRSMRFGLYQTKVGLIKILLNHKVEVCEQTQVPYVNDNKSFFLQPLGGKIYLKITK